MKRRRQSLKSFAGSPENLESIRISRLKKSPSTTPASAKFKIPSRILRILLWFCRKREETAGRIREGRFSRVADVLFVSSPFLYFGEPGPCSAGSSNWPVVSLPAHDRSPLLGGEDQPGSSH